MRPNLDVSARPRARAWTAGAGLLALFAAVSAAADDERSLSRGIGETVVPNLLPCNAPDARPSAVGRVFTNDGLTWRVPAKPEFDEAPKASDLYNPCNNLTPAGLEAIDTSTVPVIEIDADGEVITGHLFADNYFELYVNGRLVAVDPVPYLPLNSAIVRFKVKRPITYALKLVDWEEDLGIGTERGANGGYAQPGRGGFIARFTDGTVTDASWKAQTFYIAPLDRAGEVVEHKGVRTVEKTEGANAASEPCGERCYAIHWRIPTWWFVPAFDDRRWPNAKEFSEADVEARGATAFTAFSDTFSGAKFIWSNDLTHDNLVLFRKIVE